MKQYVEVNELVSMIYVQTLFKWNIMIKCIMYNFKYNIRLALFETILQISV